MKRQAAVGKPRLLVLSHVPPFPRSAGQHQRVFYTLQAAREKFHVTFATVAGPESDLTREKLLTVCDDILLLPSVHGRNVASRLFHLAVGTVYATTTGLKRSNYAIGRVEFHPRRIATFLGSRAFDCVLFEYWHAAASTAVFRQRHIPCVLDMHDILWKSYSHALEPLAGFLGVWKRWAVRQYKAEEERAWTQFDAVVAINRDEERLVSGLLSGHVSVFHAPMGTDLSLWPYSPQPSTPPRLAYYGALGGQQNEQSALRCLTQIMPAIWEKVPDAELWLVGSNPSESLRRLGIDSRVHVTGYVEHVQQVLRTMSAVVCPWIGTFGFRSRLIEVMALGVPVVVSPDAVYGMELQEGKGVLRGRTDAELVNHVLRLITDATFAREQGKLARDQVEQVFSLENTYGRLIADLDRWLRGRQAVDPGANFSSPPQTPGRAMAIH